MDNPTTLAKAVAELLTRDPVMSRQIKEHVRSDDLFELLGVAPEMIPADYEREMVLLYAFKNIPLAEVIAYYNRTRNPVETKPRNVSGG